MLSSTVFFSTDLQTVQLESCLSRTHFFLAEQSLRFLEADGSCRNWVEAEVSVFNWIEFMIMVFSGKDWIHWEYEWIANQIWCVWWQFNVVLRVDCNGCVTQQLQLVLTHREMPPTRPFWKWMNCVMLFLAWLAIRKDALLRCHSCALVMV